MIAGVSTLNVCTTALTTLSTVVDNGSACRDESSAGKAVQETETHTHKKKTKIQRKTERNSHYQKEHPGNRWASNWECMFCNIP